jgi:hypothetical protein
MNRQLGTRIVALVALIVACGFATTVSGQVFTGRVDLTVEDSSGGRVPGVIVELTGPVDLTQITDVQGQAHFLNLPVGTYAIKAALAGFAGYANDTVEVVSGAATALSAKLGVAGTAETVIVTAATPVVDVRRTSTTTNVTMDELQNVPNARDPWVVMQTVPTVYMDRVNVGGAESGQQSNYNAKGALASDNTWSIDGVPVTDMGATGASAFYYDFDSFQEMAITTGGGDAQNATSGVQLNMMLRKGSNVPHVNARYYFENQSLQAVNISPSLAEALGNEAGTGNRTDKYDDYGFDIGGPIFRDRLFIWGTMARTTINLPALTGDLDKTDFQTWAIKVDGRVTKSVRGNFTYYDNDKSKNGRGVGATRPPETAWNQRGPTALLQGRRQLRRRREVLRLGEGRARRQRVRAGAGRRPRPGLLHRRRRGGPQLVLPVPERPAAGIRRRRRELLAVSTRSSSAAGGDRRRSPPTRSGRRAIWWRPGSIIRTCWKAARNYQAATGARYVNAFLTDTIALNRLTIIGGVRFDRQDSSLGAASVPAVPNIPVLPALSAPAVDDVYKWRSITPRVGLTYALDRDRKGIVRASYGMFASQLPGSEAAFVSPIQYSYAYYNAVDLNADGVAQVGEILFNQGLQGYSGFDPAHPSQLLSVNRVDPNIKAPITHEYVVGLDREIVPSFGVSASFTYRRMTDLLWDPLTGVSSSDYVQTGSLSGTLPELGSYNVPFYALRAGAVPPGGGQTETNRQGYHQRYWGLEVMAHKRLSRRWMGRFGFSTHDWRESFDNPSLSILDPTRAPSPDLPARPFAGPDIDGGPVVRRSDGSGKSNIYLVAPSYQVVANGLYQGPWG